jgi:hypothetical protein
MGKSSKRNIDDVEVDTYESDGGFVSDDGKAHKTKKTKKEKAAHKGNGGGNNQFWTVRSSSELYGSFGR